MSYKKKKGYLKAWKDDRGFGFIKPDDGSQDVFIHISALKKMARRPNKGDIIFYDLSADADGKLRAVEANIDGVEIIQQRPHPIKRFFWITAAALSLVSAAATGYLVMV